MNDRILRAAQQLPVDATPVWIMRQAGRYLPEYRAIREKVSFLQLCKTPDLAAEVTIQPVQRLGVDAAIIFSDILIPVEAMGLELELEDSGPRFPSPIRTSADIRRLAIPDPEQETGFVGEAIRKANKALKLFDKLTETIILFLRMQVAAGARLVQIFDSWGGELSPADFDAFSLPYLQRIVTTLKASKVPVILFGTSMSTLLPRLMRSGADVIGLDWRIEIDEGRRILGSNVAVQGNLDPAALFLPRAQLVERVHDILRRAGPTGHIFNLGHGILPPTPPEAAQALVEAVHRFKRT